MVLRYLKESKSAFTAAIASAAACSASLSVIPLVSGIGERGIPGAAYVIAIIFWAGLVSMFVAAGIARKVFLRYREDPMIGGNWPTNKMPGIFRFSLKGRNWILYAIALVGLILIVADIAFRFVPEVVMFPIISVTILSFAIHSIVDGKYYIVYKQIKERVNYEKSHET